MAVDAATRWTALRRYVLASALGHVAWEILQLPLYTIWLEGSPSQIAFAVVHCTAGDLLIAATTLAASLFTFGRDWPGGRVPFRNVAIATIALGITYTFFSEWLNVHVRGAWKYSDWMPLVPLLGTGLSPVLQWLAVPFGAFLWIRSTSAPAPEK